MRTATRTRTHTYAGPLKESDAKPTAYELKTQGTDIAKGDKIRKYTDPSKPPPFLHQAELQQPGLPAIPVPPPLDMPSMFDENPFQDVQDSSFSAPVLGDSGDRAGLAAAMNVLNKIRQQ